MVDFTIFKNLKPGTLPSTALYDPDELDFELLPRSKAVDAGVALPNVTVDITGTAPDLGAYEIGTQRPHYGPRH
jgi:hypothetical protein